jgi:hypothetical protein
MIVFLKSCLSALSPAGAYLKAATYVAVMLLGMFFARLFYVSQINSLKLSYANQLAVENAQVAVDLRTQQQRSDRAEAVYEAAATKNAARSSIAAADAADTAGDGKLSAASVAALNSLRAGQGQ